MTFKMSDCDALLSRRSVLKGGLTLSLSALISVSSFEPVMAMTGTGTYSVSFNNQRSGETFSGVYRVGNKYLPQAFERINYVMRDVREDEIFPMDPRVIDIISLVHKYLKTDEPYTLLSGYRSPHTNAALRSNGEGVAKRSLHMSGQAIDVRLGEISAQNIRKAAIKLAAGGVGYYPKSGFVHMDSGAFRTW
jgi:uncharacterized protein YcbK (DUF882 family)